ncbi:MAG: peptidase, partial [Phycisphaerales bacterium]
MIYSHLSTRLLTAGVLACAAAAASAGGPEVKLVEPPGARRGEPFVLTITGERLSAPLAIHFHRAGVRVEKVTAVDEKTVKAECVADAGAEPGEYPFRLRTAGGLSDLHTIFIGAFACVDEQEPNAGLETAQRIAMNTTVHGVVTNEDADWYVVDAKQGQRLSVEVEAMRLGRSLFDPAIAVLDARRFELAVCDDSQL